LPCGLVLAHRFTFFNNSGVSAAAIGLPCHGADATPPGLVTLNDYARSITDALTEPTLLAGPSAGGFAITAAAERDLSHMAGLIYLSAYIPAPGLSLADLRRAGPCQPLGRALHLSDDRLPFRCLTPQRRAGCSSRTARNRPPPGPCHSWDPRRFCRNRCRFLSATYLKTCRATPS
jgi:pimeloyl-ACP methyl ester carboxylesterase